MKYGERYGGRRFKTVFAGGGTVPQKVADDVRRVGKRLDELGLTPENAGNISVRTRRGMLITVGGVNKGVLKPEDVVEVVSFDGERAKVVGKKEPSSETPMHWLIYQTFPEVAAVIHVHDDQMVDAADSIGVPVTAEFAHYGTGKQAREVVKALEGGNYAVIRGHGVISVGGTLDEALERILEARRRLRR